MDELEQIARSDFGLHVVTRLPITESFSSTVISFIAADQRHYVLKRHWARGKAEREIAALRALEAHPRTPALLAVADHGDALTLLIEGLAGSPWANDGEPEPELLRELGRSMARIHLIPVDSFDGMASWHELLGGNADRYLAAIGSEDRFLAEHARRHLDEHLDEVPNSTTPCLVHFDLRPGNILVDRGQLSGIIDFETSRGGHASMDFFKLWQQVPGCLARILAGYGEVAGRLAGWADPGTLVPLMRIYSAYHGLAGLAWCHTRGDFTGDFPDVNRALIRHALAEPA